MALMEYGPKWRRLRKTMGMFTSMTEVKKFTPSMDLESTVMMYEYLKEPHLYYQHNARFSNSVVMSVCFGRRTEKGDELVVHTALSSDIEYDFAAVYPGSQGDATRFESCRCHADLRTSSKSLAMVAKTRAAGV
jgi:hypothetical protein